MADIFYAILIVWVLYRIFGGSSVKTFSSPQNPTQPRKSEGDVTISSNKNNNKKNNNKKNNKKNKKISPSDWRPSSILAAEKNLGRMSAIGT